jgi:hypothetical protein
MEQLMKCLHGKYPCQFEAFDWEVIDIEEETTLRQLFQE